jgi:hypothetical protein
MLFASGTQCVVLSIFVTMEKVLLSAAGISYELEL